MTIFVAKVQYFISVKTLSVDSMTWNSQDVIFFCKINAKKPIKMHTYYSEMKILLLCNCLVFLVQLCSSCVEQLFTECITHSTALSCWATKMEKLEK